MRDLNLFDIWHSNTDSSKCLHASGWETTKQRHPAVLSTQAFSKSRTFAPVIFLPSTKWTVLPKQNHKCILDLVEIGTWKPSAPAKRITETGSSSRQLHYSAESKLQTACGMTLDVAHRGRRQRTGWQRSRHILSWTASLRQCCVFL